MHLMHFLQMRSNSSSSILVIVITIARFDEYFNGLSANRYGGVTSSPMHLGLRGHGNNCHHCKINTVKQSNFNDLGHHLTKNETVTIWTLITRFNMRTKWHGSCTWGYLMRCGKSPHVCQWPDSSHFNITGSRDIGYIKYDVGSVTWEWILAMYPWPMSRSL